MNLNKIVDSVNRTVKESLIDYPQDTLPSSVWDMVDGVYVINPQVKEKILGLLKKQNLLNKAKQIRIVGSICSNQYTEDADIDVHIVPKNMNEFDEADVKSVMQWYNDNRDEIGGWVEKHPIEVYIQLHPPQDFLSYGVYDLIQQKWEKGPQQVSLDYDPYQDFDDIVKDVSEYVEDADVLFGELKRHVIDYNTIKKAVQNIPHDKKDKLLKQLVQKLQDIEDNIEQLYGEKKQWTDLRKQMSFPESVEQAKQDIKMIEQWKNTDALFKFINRYKYLQIINDLYDMLEDDGKIDNSEMRDVNKIIGVAHE